MAGLTAGRRLKDAGHEIEIFDKGRGPGGRMSTRRAEVEGQTLRFDHGAQYISPNTDAFAAEVQGWVEAGAAQNWDANIVSLGTTGEALPAAGKPIYVGVPGMNGIIRQLADGLDVGWGRRVSSVEKTATWTLRFEDGSEEAGYDLIVVAVPAEQVGDIVRQSSPELAAIAGAVTSDPCWTIMAAFEAPLSLEWDAARLENSPLGWIARNASKPERGEGETWVLQATADWSREHIEDERDAVEAALMSAFRQIVPAPEPLHISAHRWRYSQVREPGSALYYLNGDNGLSACGDWCSGPKVEDAWLSGAGLAQAILDGR